MNIDTELINSQIKDVEDFMTSFNQPLLDSPDYRGLSFRLSLIKEELSETVNSKNFLDYFDGCLDTLYVVYGSFASLGIRRRITELDFVCPYIDNDPLHKMTVHDEDSLLSMLKIYQKTPYCSPDPLVDQGFSEEDLQKCFKTSQYSIHTFLCEIIYAIHSRFSGKMRQFLVDGWKVVHESNMSKLFSENELNDIHESWTKEKVKTNPEESGKIYIVKNENGKVMKSPSYVDAREGLRKILIGE